jgi:DNA-binding NarL/FixJ family response regulator
MPRRHRVTTRRAIRGAKPTGEVTGVRIVVASASPESRARCIAQLTGDERLDVIGEAGSPDEAITWIKQRPDILLLDVRLLTDHRGAFLSLLRRASRRTRVILVAPTGTEDLVIDGLCYGALGYLDLDADVRSLSKAVQVVHSGQAWIPRSMVAELVHRFIQLSSTRRGSRLLKPGVAPRLIARRGSR